MVYICPDGLHLFCYLCGHYIFDRKVTYASPARRVKGSRGLTETFKKAYHAYFNEPFQNESYAPSRVCVTCYNRTVNWYKGSQGSESNFAMCYPCQWFSCEDHNKCYLCKVLTLISENKSMILFLIFSINLK